MESFFRSVSSDFSGNGGTVATNTVSTKSIIIQDLFQIGSKTVRLGLLRKALNTLLLRAFSFDWVQNGYKYQPNGANSANSNLSHKQNNQAP